MGLFRSVPHVRKLSRVLGGGMVRSGKLEVASVVTFALQPPSINKCSTMCASARVLALVSALPVLPLLFNASLCFL